MKKGFILFFLLCTVITACIPVETENNLAFQSIESKSDGAYIGQQQYNALQPGIIVITNHEELDRNGLWFSKKAQDFLTTLNYNNQFAVVVFMGWKSTSGFEIEVENIVYLDERIQIIVNATNPNDSQETISVVTSPYHLVWVRKNREWSKNLTYEVILSGEIIASFPPPNP